MSNCCEVRLLRKRSSTIRFQEADNLIRGKLQYHQLLWSVYGSFEYFAADLSKGMLDATL